MLHMQPLLLHIQPSPIQPLLLHIQPSPIQQIPLFLNKTFNLKNPNPNTTLTTTLIQNLTLTYNIHPQ
jgi:hypothetical protein